MGGSVRFTIVAVAAFAASGAWAEDTSVSLPSGLDDDALLEAAMTALYGERNEDRDCWLGEEGDGGLRACMKPIAISGDSDSDWRWIVTSGAGLNADDVLETCHACSGLLGLAVLVRSEAGGWSLAADNGLAEPIGSWGTGPSDDEIAFLDVGPGRNAVRVDSGYTGQGITYGWTDFYTFDEEAGAIERIGELVSYFSDDGRADCADTENPCHTYDMTIAFDDTAASVAGHYPMQIDLADGSDSPEPGIRHWTVPFDPAEARYVPPRKLAALLDN